MHSIGLKSRDEIRLPTRKKGVRRWRDEEEDDDEEIAIAIDWIAIDCLELDWKHEAATTDGDEATRLQSLFTAIDRSVVDCIELDLHRLLCNRFNSTADRLQVGVRYSILDPLQL